MPAGTCCVQEVACQGVPETRPLQRVPCLPPDSSPNPYRFAVVPEAVLGSSLSGSWMGQGKCFVSSGSTEGRHQG